LNKTPAIKDIDKVVFLPVEEINLSNGLKLYLINAGDQPVCKIDVVFDAGMANYKNRVLPSAVNALLNDGTSSHSAGQLADLIDGKGAFFMAGSQMDYAKTTLFSLSRFATDVLPVFIEMINDSIFPGEEVELYKANMKQQFLIQSERVNVQSIQALLNAMFGKDGAYGDPTSISDYDMLKRDQIFEFYREKVQHAPRMIIASGKIDNDLKEFIIKSFSHLKIQSPKESVPKIFGSTSKPEEWIKIPGKNTNQVSMRLGRIGLSKEHPDYWVLSILSTILGGYFGSRLNKVLREEKGLTYGVHSYITHFKNSSYFSIHSELNRDNWEEAYAETLSVFDDLKTNLVEKEELEMVVRYIKGNLLQSFDGPFAQSNYLMTSLMLGLDKNRAHLYFDYLDHVTPEEIRVSAQNYLNENSFYKVVAGV
jgi:zinc protease